MQNLARSLLALLTALALGIGCGGLAEAFDERLARPVAISCTILLAPALGLMLWRSNRLAHLAVMMPLGSAAFLLAVAALHRAVVHARFARLPPPTGFADGLGQALTEGFAGLPELFVSAVMGGLGALIGLGLLIRRLWLNRSAAPR